MAVIRAAKPMTHHASVSDGHARLLCAIVIRALKDYVKDTCMSLDGFTAWEFLRSEGCELFMRWAWPDFDVNLMRSMLDTLTMEDLNVRIGWFE